MDTVSETLMRQLIADELTMVTEERFHNVYRLLTIIRDEQIPGAIVETGVWRGGMAIFLAHCNHWLGLNRTVWVCDSFAGCQDQRDSPFVYERESHQPGQYTVALAEVQENFRRFGLLTDPCVRFLPGWFRDTILPPTCWIERVALLRFDGDMYSSTLEVLHGLYPRVSDGGFVVMDDYCLPECRQAVTTFLTGRGLVVPILSPTTDEPVGDTTPCGAYWRKAA